jgi:hypothetical protein
MIKKNEFDDIIYKIPIWEKEYLCSIKDYAILQDFTDEELAQELLRRTSLGKELE